MYQVLGADGVPGEPVDLPILKEMAADGRLQPQTMVFDPISGQTLAACDMFVHEEIFAPDGSVISPPDSVAEAAAEPAASPVSAPASAPPPPAQAQSSGSPSTTPYPPAPTETYAPTPAPSPSPFQGLVGEQKSKVAAGLLAIFLGGLGIHGFYIGNKKMGLTILITTLCCFGLTVVTLGILGILLVPVMGLIGMGAFVQGILYLVASDAEFEQKYVVEQRWF